MTPPPPRRLTWPWSIRQRLTALVLALMVAVGLLCTWMTIGVAYLVEDHLLEGRLHLAQQSWLTALAVDPSAPGPRDELLRWGDTEAARSLPPAIAAAVRELPVGMYEWLAEEPLDGHVCPDGHDRLLAIFTDAHSTRRWLVYDTWQIESAESQRGWLGGVIAVVIVLAVVVTASIGWLASRLLLAPLARLDQQVRAGGPDSATAAALPDDEIGTLGRAIERSRTSLAAMAERERAFSRQASHELRTPVAVIEGALDLLDAQGMPPEQSRARERLRRAAARMRFLVETFLHLARADETAPLTAVPLAPAVAAAWAEQHDAAIGWTLRTSGLDDIAVRVWPPALAVTLDNLLHNAVQHGRPGELLLAWQDGALVCDNACPQPATPTAGTGIGLTIIADLATRFGWTVRREHNAMWHRIKLTLPRA